MWSCTQWESLWGEAQAQIGEVGLQLQLCEGWHHTDRHSCSSVHVHRAGWRLRRCNRPLDADTGLACIWYTLGLGRLTWVSQFRPVSVARSSVSAETETLPWLRDRNRNRSRNCASGSFGAETETETEIRSASNLQVSDRVSLSRTFVITTGKLGQLAITPSYQDGYCHHTPICTRYANPGVHLHHTLWLAHTAGNTLCCSSDWCAPYVVHK